MARVGRIAKCLLAGWLQPRVTPEVRRTDPEGIDYGWVMQTTFVVTIIVGAPIVAVLSTTVSLPTWTDRALFAVQVAAPVWLVTAICVYAYARYRHQNRDLELV